MIIKRKDPELHMWVFIKVSGRLFMRHVDGNAHEVMQELLALAEYVEKIGGSLSDEQFFITFNYKEALRKIDETKGTHEYMNLLLNLWL